MDLSFQVTANFFSSYHYYRKNSKYWDTQTSYKSVKFYNEVMPPIDVERMANSVDPDQTAP